MRLFLFLGDLFLIITVVLALLAAYEKGKERGKKEVKNKK